MRPSFRTIPTAVLSALLVVVMLVQTLGCAVNPAANTEDDPYSTSDAAVQTNKTQDLLQQEFGTPAATIPSTVWWVDCWELHLDEGLGFRVVGRGPERSDGTSPVRAVTAVTTGRSITDAHLGLAFAIESKYDWFDGNPDLEWQSLSNLIIKDLQGVLNTSDGAGLQPQSGMQLQSEGTNDAIRCLLTMAVATFVGIGAGWMSVQYGSVAFAGCVSGTPAMIIGCPVLFVIAAVDVFVAENLWKFVHGQCFSG